MRRLAALILCTFALGASCSNSTSAPAATVNGTNISTRELVDELNAINANPDYIKSLQASPPTGAAGVSVVGSTPGSFDAGFVSQTLLRQILFSMVHSEVTKRHLTADDACRLEATNDAKQNLGQGDSNSGQAFFDKFPKTYQDLLVQRNVDVLLLENALADQQCGKGPDAEAYYNAHQADFTRLCISIIAVNDQAAADSAVAQLKAGADFATLAQQVSVDPTSAAKGGDIGCKLPSEIGNTQVAQLLQAGQIGQVKWPVTAEGYGDARLTVKAWTAPAPYISAH